MAMTAHPKIPAIPNNLMKKVREEHQNESFKGKSQSITFLEPKAMKNQKCNKINAGKGKDIFIRWNDDTLEVIGFSEQHGNGGNKTYKGYLCNNSQQDIVIK